MPLVSALLGGVGSYCVVNPVGDQSRHHAGSQVGQLSQRTPRVTRCVDGDCDALAKPGTDMLIRLLDSHWKSFEASTNLNV